MQTGHRKAASFGRNSASPCGSCLGSGTSFMQCGQTSDVGSGGRFSSRDVSDTHYPLMRIIFSRTFLLAICGLELALTSHVSTCFNVTEC